MRVVWKPPTITCMSQTNKSRSKLVILVGWLALALSAFFLFRIYSGPSEAPQELTVSFETLHHPKTGPALLSQAQHLEALASLFHKSPLKNHRELSLAYVGHRLRGLTAEKILKLKHGKEMFLAQLIAEASPPDWWKKHGAWMQDRLETEPGETYQMGILSYRVEGPILFHQVANTPDPDDRPDHMAEMVHIVTVHPDITTPERKKAILDFAGHLKGQH